MNSFLQPIFIVYILRVLMVCASANNFDPYLEPFPAGMTSVVTSRQVRVVFLRHHRQGGGDTESELRFLTSSAMAVVQRCPVNDSASRVARDSAAYECAFGPRFAGAGQSTTSLAYYRADHTMLTTLLQLSQLYCCLSLATAPSRCDQLADS